MKNILVFADYYYPGIKAGGPAKSIYNLINNLSSYYNFNLVTRNKDLGEKDSYYNIINDKWINEKTYSLIYLNNSYEIFKIIKIICNKPFDIMYLNSFFSFKYSIIPILLINILKREKNIICAPRGEFALSALGNNYNKKHLFIYISKMIGLYNNVKWHATSKHELIDIKKYMGDSINVKLAPIISTLPKINLKQKIRKNKNHLSILFLSRIVKIKNLDYSLEIISKLKGNIIFNIYGPIEDKKYWKFCTKLISELPSNITCKYQRIATHDDLPGIFNKHHLFILPSKGENYGNVIIESLINGTPVIISDKTPFNNLIIKNIGADIPLDQQNKYIKVINDYVIMENNQYLVISKNAHLFAKNIIASKNIKNNNIDLFKI